VQEGLEPTASEGMSTSGLIARGEASLPPPGADKGSKSKDLLFLFEKTTINPLALSIIVLYNNIILTIDRFRQRKCQTDF